MAKNPLNTAAEDDLKSMGLPPAFTVDDLRDIFDPAEIAAMADGDDPLLDELPEDMRAAAVKPKSAFEELNPGMEDDDAEKADADEPADAPDEDEDDADPDDDADAGDDDDGDEDDADPDDDADAGDDDDGDEEDADADEAEADDQPGDDPAQDDTPDPVLTVKDTAALETKLNAFDDDIEKLQDQYDDGELSNAEFKTKLKEISSAQAKATLELERATEDNAKAQQDYAGAWYGRVTAFTATRPELLDQTPIAGLPEGASAYKVFDQALKHVNSADGAARFGGLSMAQRVAAAAELADAYVQKTAGKPLLPKAKPKAKVKADPAPAPEKDSGTKKAETPGPRKDKRPDAIKTLANVPTATDNDVQDSRFAALDKMDPLDAEAALDRMSPAERAKYLAG